MSQQCVERTIGKLCTDEAFRARFFADPARAAWDAGLALTAAELEALAAISVVDVARLGRKLDPRISRLTPERNDDETCPK
jgi:putative modified peptide